MESEWKRLLDDSCMLRLTMAEEEAIRRQWPSVLRSASLPPMAGEEPADFRPEKPCAALRADEPSACLDRETALSNAPASADGLITVPHALS